MKNISQILRVPKQGHEVAIVWQEEKGCLEVPIPVFFQAMNYGENPSLSFLSS
jgi:hypothetical protein